MEYVLGLGLGCKVYKKYPRIRIFSNDILIDEFNMDHTDKSKTILGKCLPTSRNTRTLFLPSKLRLYHLDEKTLLDKQGDLTIEVYNDDSNYTNGFMTKSSLINFNTIFLIPKFLFENKLKVWHELFDRIYDIGQAEIQRNSKKTFIPRRVPHAYKTSIHWPWVHHGEWKSIYLYSNMGASNKQNLEEDDFQKFSKHLWKNTWPDDAIIVKEGKVFAENIQTNWFGGSGVMLYKIIKKHKILFLAKEGLPKYGNFWNTSAMFNRIFSNHDYS